jgi:L-alanine-DL-glutamate epimerase-like enolase superfamily enzyme
MKIEAIDFFYLSMPEIEDVADGSQDALLVRVRAGDYTGWGECEASPLVTIASLVCPMSHSACKPVAASVLGETLETPADIARIHRQVRENSMDLLQTDHALSGIDIALWDLLGKRHSEPVYRLLGFKQAHAKTPYASVLFGETAQETLVKAKKIRDQGFQAVKFGWGPFGRGHLEADVEQLEAAREGIGEDCLLCVDAGTVWVDDVTRAGLRLAALQRARVTWLEEPFSTGALHAYRELATRDGAVKLAGGEGAHNEYMARHFIDYGDIAYVQVDTGRIGGITSAGRVAAYAAAAGVQYVNHTFTSHLALSASLQPYAGLAEHELCEYPTELKRLALDLTREHLTLDLNGQVNVPERPGLGLEPDLKALRLYLVETEITVGGRLIYKTPELESTERVT